VGTPTVQDRGFQVKCTNKKSEISDHERGRISAAVAELLRRQVADRGLVVWYDPQKDFFGTLANSEI
jgi:hypothetical protein